MYIVLPDEKTLEEFTPENVTTAVIVQKDTAYKIETTAEKIRMFLKAGKEIWDGLGITALVLTSGGCYIYKTNRGILITTGKEPMPEHVARMVELHLGMLNRLLITEKKIHIGGTWYKIPGLEVYTTRFTTGERLENTVLVDFNDEKEYWYEEMEVLF